MKKNSIHVFRRLVISAFVLSLLILALSETPALSNDYPRKPIVIYVGASPGGGYDTQARLFAKYWPDLLPRKVNVIVKNISGGGGLVAANRAWVVAPDGYTIIQLKMGAFTLDQIIHASQVKFDINRWRYIGQYTADTNALAARTETVKKIRSYDELLKLALKEPLVFSAGGVGGSSHNKALIFSEASGIKMRFVQYIGTPESMAGLIRRETDYTIFSAPSIARQDKSEIQALFVFSKKRSKVLPDTPTAIEFGVPEEVFKRANSNPIFSTPRALALPPDVPADALKILRDSFWKIVTSDKYIDKFEEAGQSLDPIKGEEYESQLPEMIGEVKKFAPIIQKQMK